MVLVCAAGCGRVGFDELAPCGLRNASAPDPLTIVGTTFAYANFTGSKLVVSSVDVTVLDAAGGILGTAQSDAGGSYSLSFPTGGREEVVKLVFTQPAYFTTTTWLDTPLDRDVTGKNLPIWTAGEGPMWNTGAMGTVYSVSRSSIDSTKSTLVVSAADCTGVALPGVSISVSPAPGEGEYLGSNGQPAFGASGTTAPTGAFVGFNAQPGPTRITASAPGYMFEPQTVQVTAGDQVTLVEMRPLL